MNVELAQTIALIAYGNEYLSSPRRGLRELFPSHSTFQYVYDISFKKGKTLGPLVRSEITAKNAVGWFSHLGIDGIKYLKLDLLNLDHLQPPAKSFFPVPGDRSNVDAACREYEALLRTYPSDLCALGIGENGHIAFNDPPYADFDDPVWVKVVKLDEASRRQQAGEGHFPDLESVPTHAITLTIPALLSARKVLAIVPEERKAPAVQRALQGPIEEQCPASILRQWAQARLYLDRDSAALAFPNL